MTRSIYKVENVLLTLKPVVHLDCVAFDSNAAFTLQFHIIKYLCLEIPFRNGICQLQQSVGQSRFPMVNMSYDTEIPYVLHGRKDRKKRGVNLTPCTLMKENRYGSRLF